MPHPHLSQWIRSLPKAEIHLHLEGSVPPHRAAELAEHAKRPLPCLLRDDRAPHGFRFDIPDFGAFLRLYEALSACLVNEAQVVDIVDAVAERLHEDQVRYAEVTFTPLTILQSGMNEDTLLAALLAGKQQAFERRGVQIQWVFDFVRSIPEQAMPTVNLALKARDRGIGVVAFGVGGPEGPQWPGQPLAAAFEKARAEKLPAVPHAGEQAGAWSVWEALDIFGARRIGHGIRSIEDQRLMDRLRDERICLEVCPSSNIQLVHVPSFQEHPVHALMEHGIPVTLGTDDPGLLGTTLAGEYEECAEAFGWDAEKLCAVAEAGALFSFAPEATKEALVREQREHLARWEAGSR